MQRSERDRWVFELGRSARRIDAAQGMFKGAMEQFFASLQVGCDSERQSARDAVLASHEALLDAFEFNAWLMLEREGINPNRRHL